MRFILRYVCWDTHRPPPPRQMTAGPAGPQGLGQPGGGEPPRPPQPPKKLHTPQGHALASGGFLGEMEDNPEASCVAGTNVWPDNFKLPRALMV